MKHSGVNDLCSFSFLASSMTQYWMIAGYSKKVELFLHSNMNPVQLDTSFASHLLIDTCYYEQPEAHIPLYDNAGD